MGQSSFCGENPSLAKLGTQGFRKIIACLGSATYPAITPRGLAPLSSCLPSNLILSTQKVSCHCSSSAALFTLQPFASHHCSTLSNGLYLDRSSCSISAAARNCFMIPDLTSYRAACLAHAERPRIFFILSVLQRTIRSVFSILEQ